MRALHEVMTRTRGTRQGGAVFAGTRVSVKQLIDHLDRGGTVADFLARYPQLEPDQVAQALALGLEALVARVPVDPLPAQASLLPRTDKRGVILNPEELTAALVVGRTVRCPACRDLVFESWPEGWNAHAARRCRGLRSTGPAGRQAEFKRRFEHLFR
ncbi:MAG: DUF433 domain-containing protein [Gemmatimonadales bacterium]